MLKKVRDGCVIFLTVVVIIGIVDNSIKRTENIQTEPDKKTYCADAEDYGYANGLVMAGRILGENEYLREQGWNKLEKPPTCQQVVDDLYNEGLPVASGEYKFSRDYNFNK